MIDHDIVPAKGTAVRATDGLPADLMNVTDYPVLAVCSTCQRPIGCPRMYLADWHHVPEQDAPLTETELRVLRRIIGPIEPRRVVPIETA